MLEQKDTGALMNELMKSNSIDIYFKDNANYMITEELHIYLQNLLNKLGLKKSEIIRNTELSEVYGYQIFSGERTPSRDALLCVCIAMKLDIETTQNLLKISGYAPLYSKSMRDSIIVIGIQNKLSVYKINEALYNQGEPTLNK